MNQQELAAWTWVGLKIALAVITVFNLKRIVRGIVKIFGPDGIDKKEFGGVVLLSLGIYMVYMEAHRIDLQHQLFSDWLYLIVFGGAMIGLGMKDFMRLLAAFKSVPLQKESANESGPVIVEESTDQATR